MAKVHDALRQLERERQRQVLVRPAGQESRPSWKHWFVRRPRPAQRTSLANGMSQEQMQRVAARLDVLEKHVSVSGANHSDAVLLERMDMIASKLDLLEERMSKSIPSAEQLLHTLEAQLAALERPLITRISDVTNPLSERTTILSTRITVLLVLSALTLLGIWFRL